MFTSSFKYVFFFLLYRSLTCKIFPHLLLASPPKYFLNLAMSPHIFSPQPPLSLPWSLAPAIMFPRQVQKGTCEQLKEFTPPLCSRAIHGSHLIQRKAGVLTAARRPCPITFPWLVHPATLASGVVPEMLPTCFFFSWLAPHPSIFSLGIPSSRKPSLLI